MHAQRNKISFIGLGSKSAAPLLYSYLRAHPQICTANKSINFFSDTKKFAEGVSWYEMSFPECEEGSVTGELSETYLQSTQAASLIARTYSTARLFAVIENPLVSVRVAYIDALRSKLISSKISLPLFLKQYPEVLRNACYGRQLVQYFSFYSINDLMVIAASDVRNEPLGVLKNLYKHIGVDDKFVPIPLLHLVPPEEIDPKKRPGIIRRTIKKIFGLFKGFYVFIVRRFKTPVIATETIAIAARRMPLDPELEKYLKSYYREDVDVLSKLLHRNFNIEWEIE